MAVDQDALEKAMGRTYGEDALHKAQRAIADMKLPGDQSQAIQLYCSLKDQVGCV